MSRWFPDHLQVAFEPGRLGFNLAAGQDRSHWTIPVAASLEGDAAPWQAALTALASELRSLPARHVIDVTLHSSLIRFVMVPWHHDFVSGADRRSLVEHTFVQVYGDVARAWRLCSSDTVYGRPAVAAAIDAPLFDAVRQQCLDAGHVPGRIQPDLMISFNQAQAQIKEQSFWFAMVDASSYLLLLTLDGVPAAIQAARRSEGTLAMLLDRTWLSLGVDGARCTVYLDTTPAAALDLSAGQWTLRRIAAPAVMPRKQSSARPLAASTS